MCAMPEAKMGIRVSANIEPVGIRKTRGITVRGADHGEDELACWNLLPMQIDIVRGHAIHPLQRRSVSKYFLDGQGQKTRMGPDGGKLVGIFHKGKECIADEISCGLTARKEEQLEKADDFFSGKPVAIDFSLSELREQVLARRGAAPRLQLTHVRIHLRRDGPELCDRFARTGPARDGITHLEQDFDPSL